MYIVKFKMEELMPYESIVKKTITEQCKQVFDVAHTYGMTTYKTDYPYIKFEFDEIKKNDALDFFIKAKNLVDYIDIEKAKGEQSICQNEVN